MNVHDFVGLRRGNRIDLSKLIDEKALQAVHIESTGKKRALLVLHGFSSSPDIFRIVLPELSKHYDGLLCPLLPGHGSSIADFSNTKAQDWITAAEKACEYLLQHYAEVDILGLSLGAVLGYGLASRFKIAHVYLLAPPFEIPLSLKRTAQLLKFCFWLGFREVRSLAGKIQSTTHHYITYKRLPLRAVNELLNCIELTATLKPNCPIDLFLGCHDEVINCQSVAAHFEKLEKVNFHWLQNSAHLIPLESDFCQIIAAISQRSKNKVKNEV